MKTFVKTTLMAAALAGCATFATAQVQFGVKAGLNLANMTLDGEDLELDGADTKMLVSFQAGVVADISIAENFVIQPGFFLVGKGVRVEENEFEATLKPYYLQVPLMFLYKSNMFYAGLGPYAGFGIGGDYTEQEVGEEDYTEDIKFGNSEEDFLAPLDFGAQVEAGVDLPVGLRIGVGYALGLMNVAPSDVRDNSDISFKHGVLSLNVAYMFGGGGE